MSQCRNRQHFAPRLPWTLKNGFVDQHVDSHTLIHSQTYFCISQHSIQHSIQLSIHRAYIGNIQHSIQHSIHQAYITRHSSGAFIDNIQLSIHHQAFIRRTTFHSSGIHQAFISNIHQSFTKTYFYFLYTLKQ